MRMAELGNRFLYSIFSNSVALDEQIYSEGAKHVHICVNDMDIEEDDSVVADIYLCFYSPYLFDRDAMDLFDEDHGDTMVIASALQSREEIDFDDMRLVVYLEDISVQSDLLDADEVKAFLYANLGSIICQLTWIEPDCIMFCAQDKDEAWVGKAVELNDEIRCAGDGKAADPGDHLHYYFEIF